MDQNHLALARQLHRQSLEREEEAGVLRERRDNHIRQLREEDPKRWTYERIAQEVGVSLQLVAYIVKGR